MPKPDVDMKDIPELSEDEDDEDEEPYTGKNAVEEDDQVFIATILCKAEFICTTSNILQRLAEVFYRNMKPKSFTEAVPTYLHDFEDLFLKALFDQLPDQKIWNHAIKLTPDTKCNGLFAIVYLRPGAYTI
jgi:hypothetical protein